MLCKHTSFQCVSHWNNVSQSRSTKVFLLFTDYVTVLLNIHEFSQNDSFIYSLIWLKINVFVHVPMLSQMHFFSPHLTDGLRLTRTWGKLSFHEPHLFSVTESVQVQHSCMFSANHKKSSTLQSNTFERLGGVSPVETLQRYPCSALQTQTHLFWSVINGSN